MHILPKFILCICIHQHISHLTHLYVCAYICTEHRPTFNFTKEITVPGFYHLYYSNCIPSTYVSFRVLFSSFIHTHTYMSTAHYCVMCDVWCVLRDVCCLTYDVWCMEWGYIDVWCVTCDVARLTCVLSLSLSLSLPTHTRSYSLNTMWIATDRRTTSLLVLQCYQRYTSY